MNRPLYFQDPDACIDWLLAAVGRRLVVGAPLGLGKPNHLINALYARVRADTTIQLELLTALSLETPRAAGELERRLVEPLRARIFGDYPDLDYVADMRADRVPDNIRISEFFFQPGAMLGSRHAQQHYRSTNYTHVARDLLDAGANVLMQMVAPHPDGDRYSLSSNPDVTLELIPEIEARRARGEAIAVLAQANAQMPYMGRDAEVDAGLFDAVLAADFKPFGPPAMAVSDADYAIGAHASVLLADGGTLQIGIGSLSDAIARCAILRQTDNAAYRALAAPIAERYSALIETQGGLGPFERGLYGCTEMLVAAYLELYRAGVIKRRVYGDIRIQRLLDSGAIGEAVTPDTLRTLIDEGAVNRDLTAADVEWLVGVGVFRDGVHWRAGELQGPGLGYIGADLSEPAHFEAVCAHCLGDALAGPTVVHAGFFLGPQSFYEGLRSLPDDERRQFCMTAVNRINHLYGGEALRRSQRRHARFINTALMATALGAVVSDGLEDGRVLSGVGGQYNFVAQAQALTDARSILCVRATRESGGQTTSNIIWNYGHVTIPRHLRDIVISEYGIADLRGKTDAEVIATMIEIADARFQDELAERAIAAGKLPADYRIPPAARDNTPERIARWLDAHRERLPAFPFGTDFSEQEIVLSRALRGLQALPRVRLLPAALANLGALLRPPAAAQPYLVRMRLAEPVGIRERLLARVVVLALVLDGALGD